MIAPILVPKLGMTQSDITVLKWLKADGEHVEKDQGVVTIETAKVTYDLQAPESGLVFSLKKVKSKVRIGDTVGVVADSKEAFQEYEKPEAEGSQEAGEFLDFDDDWGEGGVQLSFEGEEEEAETFSLPPVEVGDRKVLERIPFLGMRRTIANNLVASLQTGAQLTVFSETDMTELANFRKEMMLDRPEAPITFVDMLVKLLASVLKEFPILNSTVAGDEIICWGEYHIGVAVALDQGLVVPVVRNVDRKSLVAVSREVRKLAQKARNNQLEPEHYQGGTFTLSSGGKVDVDFMTPIINPPENAILGIGKIGPRPAIYKGSLTVRTITYLCLTHDHRVIDGVPAAMFLGRLKEIIENPDLFRKILK
jgi:pyruvate dehydrogenase E2 component (dihydrolipoamide acetyltransferase)